MKGIKSKAGKKLYRIFVRKGQMKAFWIYFFLCLSVLIILSAYPLAVFDKLTNKNLIVILWVGCMVGAVGIISNFDAQFLKCKIYTLFLTSKK